MFKALITPFDSSQKSLRKTTAYRECTVSALIAVSLVTICVSTLGACNQMQIGQEKPKSYLSYVEEGNIAMSKQDYVTAEKSFSTARELAEKQYGPEGAPLPTILTYLGQIYRGQGEWRLAYNVYKKLVPLKQKLEPKKTKEIAQLKAEYAEVLEKMKKYGIQTDEEIEEEVHNRGKKQPAKKPVHGRRQRH